MGNLITTKIIILKFLLLIDFYFLLGQSTSIYFHNLTSREKLISNTNSYFVSEDSKGYIWISSFSGLSRFDGEDIIKFRSNESTEFSLSDGIIQSRMYEDHSGRLWFNNSREIQFFDLNQSKFHSISLKGEQGESFSDYQLFYFDPILERVWFFTGVDTINNDYPLYSLDVNKTQEPILIGNAVTYDYQGLNVFDNDKNDLSYLVISQSSKWEIIPFIRKDGQYSFYPSHQIEITSPPKSSYQDEIGNLWLTNRDGTIYKCDVDSSVTILDTLALDTRIVDALIIDSDHLLVATGNNELLSIYLEHGLTTLKRDLIATFNKSVQNLFLDKNRNLWVSTAGDGIYYGRIERLSFPAYLSSKSENSVSSNVKSIIEGPDGSIWCLVENEIIKFDKVGKTSPVLIQGNQLSRTQQRDFDSYHLFKDSTQNVWLATKIGLFCLVNGGENFIKIPCSGHKDYSMVVTSVSELSSGRLLVSTYEKGIWEVKQDSLGYCLEPFKGGTTKGIYARISQDLSSRLFLSEWGKSIQLCELTEENFRLLKEYPFPHLVYEMEASPDSSGMWIASPQGLHFLDFQLDSILTEELFTERFISANSLVFDDLNRLWVSTSQGLVLYPNPRIMEKDFDSPPETFFRVFDTSDGLPSNEFNFKSFTKTHDGKLAFGSTNGYTLFDPKDITEYPVQARPTITQVLVNNEEVRGREKYDLIAYQGEEIEELILEPGERTFTFRFSAMDYGDPQATQFEYRLRDRNGKLINRGNERFVRYFNLEQGEYIFELYASNSENVWNLKPRRLALRLKPYFYETPWFYAMLLILGLMVMYAIYRNRTEHLRKKQQLTELENAILRIQMNPHFMFNSLNSIRAYLRSRDTKVASKYLKHLAKLMRKVLDVAKESEISIKEDLVFLTEHMEAEKIRFEDSFSYEIVMDEGVEAEEVMIPTMMLQPFVENAIIHGFKRNSKGGLLTLRYRIEGKQLICEVEDNGIGRKAAATHRPEGHKSKATEITLQRLALIRQKTKEPASLEIIDLTGQEGVATGTKVVIRLPIVD